jgi:hypothetical protein
MSQDELERVMIANYTRVFRDMLLASVRSNPGVTTDYLSQPIKRQREIEGEISRKSAEMAKSLVSKLRAGGLLKKESTDKELVPLIRETLKEFEVKK